MESGRGRTILWKVQEKTFPWRSVPRWKGTERTAFWKVQEKAFPRRSVPRRKREGGERLSGKFKRVHCILDDTGDVQMQAFQHHSFLTEASLPSSINSGPLPLASHQNNHLSADLLQLSKSRSWSSIPSTLPLWISSSDRGFFVLLISDSRRICYGIDTFLR
jgi:hypothetical protein